MKNFFPLFLLIIISCAKEPEVPAAPAPTQLNLTSNAIYTNLETRFVVGELFTDIPVGISYDLVSGEGDTDNANFFIEGDLLKSNVSFNSSSKKMQSVRIQASNDGSTFEESFSIEIKDFDGPQPSLYSDSFADGESFPYEFGADNGNVSPDFYIEDMPEGTESMALTMIDLDFNLSVHWAIWNIPNTFTEVKRDQRWGAGVTNGESEYGPGYTGPFPPAGETHRYEITVSFLDSKISLSPIKYYQLAEAIAGKTIAQAKITGLYTP